MLIRICENCGKILPKTGMRYCEKCREELQTKNPDKPNNDLFNTISQIASPKGRMKRGPFAVATALWIFCYWIGNFAEKGLLESMIRSNACTILVAVGIFMAVRRLHDTGTSGFAAITLFIPYLRVLMLLYLLLAKSDETANPYGELE